MCDVYGDNVSAQLDNTYRRARKPHTCCACDETIRVGDCYHRLVTLWEGQVETNEHCARCWAVCQALWAAGAEAIDLTLNCGEAWDDNFEPSPEVAALAFLTPDDMQARLAATVGEP